MLQYMITFVHLPKQLQEVSYLINKFLYNPSYRIFEDRETSKEQYIKRNNMSQVCDILREIPQND